MKTRTVRDILEFLNQAAPFDTQEAFDNSGLQVGHPDTPVHCVLLALDVTEEVIREAEALGAQLIISHHPLLFVPQKTLDLSCHVPNLLAMLIKRDIALISVHTNFDQSPQYSASAALARGLNLQTIRQQGAYLFLGELETPLSGAALKERLSSALKSPVRMYGMPDLPVTTLAIAGGAYSEGFHDAHLCGAQALLTGEVRHHHAVEAAQSGFVLFDGGHYATEAPMLGALALGLQTMQDTVEYPLQVHVSRSEPYRLQ